MTPGVHILVWGPGGQLPALRARRASGTPPALGTRRFVMRRLREAWKGTAALRLIMTRQETRPGMRKGWERGERVGRGSVVPGVSKRRADGKRSILHQQRGLVGLPAPRVLLGSDLPPHDALQAQASSSSEGRRQP